MVFQPNIPQPNDDLSDSQGDLLGNMQQLDTSFGINHYTFSDTTANNGKHKYVEFVDQVSAPPNLAAISSFYGSNTPGFSNIFWKQEFGGADPAKNQGASVQMTGLAPVLASTGYTFLPGGLLLQWGGGVINTAGSSTTFVFQTPFFSAGTIYSITLGFISNQGNSPNANTAFIKSGSITASQFEVTNSSSGSLTSIYYMAIGRTP